jgi:HEAT repeat protein/ATP/ADP translocase
MDGSPAVFTRFAALLGVRPGEGKRTALLFGHLLLASAIFILGRTVRDTLFLSRYSLSALPWMFVLYGVASSITAVVYGRFADKIARHVAIVATLGVGIVSYLGVWVLVVSGATFIYPVFYVWSEVLANLVIVQFWTLANDLHDPRAAKRLFGTIGAARVLGVVLIGASTGAIVRAIGTTQLLFLLVLLMVGIGALTFATRRLPRPDMEAQAPTRREGSVAADPYVQSLALLLLCAFTALTVGDYQFKAIARATYREDALAEFFSLFYAATGIISFAFQILLTPRLLRRLGVGWAMTVMPGVFGLASATLPFVPSLAVASTMKFADNGLQYTIHETTLQALYVPFPARAKASTRALLDAIVKPCSYGAGGMVLVLVADRWPVEKLSLVTSALVLVWLAAVPVVRKRYLASLGATLTARGALALDADFVLDAASRRALIGVLDRGEPRFVLPALEQLADDRSPELGAVLSRLCHSASAEVRRAALERLAELPGGSVEPAREALADEDPRVRAAAARAFAKLGKDECVGPLGPLLNDPAVEVRVSTIAGFLRDGGVEGAIAGGARLGTLMASPDPADRIEAARVLGEVGPAGYRPLSRLLADADAGVRRAAVKAAAAVADPRLVGALVESLRDPAVRLRSIQALAAIGLPALEPLLALMNDPNAPREVRLTVPRILRRIPSPMTYQRLFEHVNAPDSHLRLRILTCLSHVRRALGRPPEPLGRVRNLLESELARAYRNLAGWEVAREQFETPLLAEEMAFRQVRAVRRILRILELRYAPAPLRLVRERLESPGRRATALEVIDTMLEPTLRLLVMPFLDDVPIQERLAHGRAFVSKVPTAEEFMREGAAHKNPYVTLVVLDALARHGHPLAAELGELALARVEPLAREGGVFALSTRPEAARRCLPAVTADPDPTVRAHAARTLARLAGEPKLEGPMHSTVEKILFLKSAPLFAKVTGEDLAPLARVAEEQTHPAGAYIVREGDPGDSLYVVVSGKVGIRHNGETLATLGPGEAFGEMAVLDKEPRSASVVAIEETEVLRIGSQEFFEILHEQVEIAVGVILMLTQRLREAMASAGQRAPAA